MCWFNFTDTMEATCTVRFVEKTSKSIQVGSGIVCVVTERKHEWLVDNAAINLLLSWNPFKGHD